MHASFATAVRRAVSVWIGLSATGFVRERGPRVEVVCPSPPIAARIDKQQVLAYELDVTNFDPVPLTLKSLEFLAANQESSSRLSARADDRLAAAMTRVGSGESEAGSGKNAQTIEPGGCAVVFAWIALPSNRALPCCEGAS